MKDNIDVSVIMATYNPSWEKCVFTLDSIIGQKGIGIELIVTDDGSKDNLFDKIRDYLNTNGFFAYKLIEHKNNQGTVKNYLDGLNSALGTYIKLISPGDAFFAETTLVDWVNILKKSGRRWSFADAIFYTNADGTKTIVNAPTFPRVIDCYMSGNDNVCRWNYVVLEDVALGAALLCEKELFSEYLSKYSGIVKYAEDVAFSGMMFDGILPVYCNRAVVFYEYGTGISTGDKKWIEKVREDQKNAELLLTKCNPKDDLQQRMIIALINTNKGKPGRKRIVRNLQKGGIKKVVRFRLNPRLSSSDLNGCGEWWERYSSYN